MTAQAPLKERWQPVRGGLINLFKFEDQVFRYENGRLLLRGDNGSGKSRVLALQLPFLLDGEISPYRVEPDRDPAKRMEWHLLMDRHERRTGYTWIEFGRRDGEGRAHFLTLGCGLDARKGGGAPDRWFFITPGRIGHDLSLLQNRVPLGRRQLAEAFAEAGEGTVFERAGEYRAAVDDALFKLGGRYQPLIDLLIQLRQPQLMRDMKEDVLSNALSEALPPVPEPLINEVAESFQGLDTDRQRTEEHREMLDSVEGFREGYRQYLSVAIRRLCEVVRSGHSQFEHATRELRGLDERIEENGSLLVRSRVDAGRMSSEHAKLEAAIGTLRDSPEMRSKRDLDQALQRADEFDRDAAAAKSEWQHAVDELERVTAEAGQRARVHVTLKSEVAAGYQDLQRQHAVVVPAGTALFDWPDGGIGAARNQVNDLIGSRKRGVAHLRRLNDEISGCRETFERERDRMETHRGLVADAEDTVRRAEAELNDAIDGFGKAASNWERSLTVLHGEAFPRGIDWTETITDWLGASERRNPFELSLARARERVQGEFAAEQARLESDRENNASERTPINGELDHLREGRQPEPPARHGRAERPLDRPGRPFWRWFEFRDEIPVGERAGWEAGLEASGLLDAWVFPDGRFDSNGHDDDFLAIGDDSELDPAHSLAAVLRPVGGGEVLDGLLRRIGNHRSVARCWISRDGHWANGPHHGRWRKPAAEFLGHLAREAARARRIEELETLLADLDARLAGLGEREGDLDRRVEQLAAELDVAPPFDPILGQVGGLDQARVAHQDGKTRLVEADEHAAAAERKLKQSVAGRDRDAADMAMDDWTAPEKLDEFAGMLAGLENTATAFWPAWQRLLDAESELDAARERQSRASGNEQRLSRIHAERAELADSIRAGAETMLASVGATVEELMARLRHAEARAGEVAGTLKQIEGAIRDAEIDRARLEEKHGAAREKRESAEASRNHAVSRMEGFVAERLIAEIDPELQPERAGFSATAAVDLARQLEQLLREHPADDQRWHLLQSEITAGFSELCDQLGRHGLVPQLRTIDESSVIVITCEFQGQSRSAGELRQFLHDELASRERIFQEREREVIENHLIGEAAVELQRRIRDGEDWVARVNEELSEVSTSSGIRLRFAWELADEELGPVRRLFLKTTATWTLEERERIGDFLQQRIRTTRETDDTVTWREHLRRALDYRSWHRFGIQLRRDGDTGWKKLTKRTFGTGSGGEKALTLTVPQFAAAAAHYHSAHPHAPRLILLDEAFVAIDAPTRARLMGLLETFDLDYVMTSEREWGVYSTVSALAIYQLASRPGYDAVAVTRWVWNGREKFRDDSSVEESSTRPVIDDE